MPLGRANFFKEKKKKRRRDVSYLKKYLQIEADSIFTQRQRQRQ
jgi:hypothetical protein